LAAEVTESKQRRKVMKIFIDSTFCIESFTGYSGIEMGFEGKSEKE